MKGDFIVRVEVGVFVEDGLDGFAEDGGDEFVFGGAFVSEHEFNFAAAAGMDEGEIIDAGDGGGFVEEKGAALGGGDDIFGVGDGAADGNAGGLVDVRAGAGEADEFFEDVVDVGGDVDGNAAVSLKPGILFDDIDAFLGILRVVRADDGADAVFEGGDDAAAVGVVFGVGGEDHANIEVEADGVAADLDVAFFEDVEEADLDFGGEVGEFIEGEDAAVGAGDEAEVHGGFIGEVASLGVFDEVDFADEVGDGDVGGGEFFVVAGGAVDPFDGGFVAPSRIFGDEIFAVGGNGVEGVVVDFTAGNDGEPFVEEVGEHAEDAGFGLAAEAEEEDVVLGEDGVDELGDDGVAVADDSGEEGIGVAFLEVGDDVFAEFIFDGE